MGNAGERKALQGASRFDLETQYQEFIRIHGFDIREETTGQVWSTVEDTRDRRDPQRLGEALLNRPKGTNILEFADALYYGGL